MPRSYATSFPTTAGGAPPPVITTIAEAIDVAYGVTSEELREVLPGSDVLFAWRPRRGPLEEAWDRAGDLRWIQSASAGGRVAPRGDREAREQARPDRGRRSRRTRDGQVVRRARDAGPRSGTHRAYGRRGLRDDPRVRRADRLAAMGRLRRRRAAGDARDQGRVRRGGGRREERGGA